MNILAILQMNSKDNYGIFVSEALKPQNSNFEFGTHWISYIELTLTPQALIEHHNILYSS